MTEQRNSLEFLNWLDRRIAVVTLMKDAERRAEVVSEITAIAYERLTTFSDQEKAAVYDELVDWLASAQLDGDDDPVDRDAEDRAQAILKTIITYLESFR